MLVFFIDVVHAYVRFTTFERLIRESTGIRISLYVL